MNVPDVGYARDSGGDSALKNTRCVGVNQLDVVPLDLLNEFIDSVWADESIFPFPQAGLIEHPPVERPRLLPDAAIFRRGYHGAVAAKNNARLVPR